ncbi:putative nodulin homeobox protein [Helianthus annuus]|nr:putative nodulin homeobox protein [Helianthus annuus]
MQQLDLFSAVKKLHVLSSKDLGKLIRDAKNGIIKYTINGSSFEINVENLGRPLVQHILKDVSSLKPDEEHFKYLHTLCDIASHHSTLAQVFVEDMVVQEEMLNSIFSMIRVLSQLGKWKDIADVLLAHPEIVDFTTAALTAVRLTINLLQAKPTTQCINSRMQPNNEVYCLFHLCESSVQFIQSLCKQLLFRERLVEKKELCGGGAVFRLVQDSLNLPQHDDPFLESVVNRLKAKVLSIMLLLCQAESSSFMDMASSTPQGKGFAQATVLKVIEELDMMCDGDLKSQTNGLLLINAMKLTEIFSGASGFKTFTVHNLTELLTRVLSQPQREFLSTWCSYDPEPTEEEIVVDFNPTLAAGHVLGLTSEFNVQHSTWSNWQAPQTPYAIQRSSLLVQVLTNLTCCYPEEDNARFINGFLECLQTESSELPGGAAERTDATRKNLSSLSAYAESMTPNYLQEEYVNVLRWFISQLEKPTAQESASHRVMFDEEHPAPKLSKAEQEIQNALLKIENERPENIRLWATRLKDLFNGKMSLEINVPKQMYPKTSFDIQVESIEYEGMLQFLANGLLEASFLHWCQIYLYNIVFYKIVPEDPKVAYFNIHKITGKECETNFASVKEHLLSVYKLKKGTKYFLAPFFIGNIYFIVYNAHWVLFIVSPKERSVWILDSTSVKAQKNKDDYPLSRAIESSFGSGLTWTMVQCMQQDGSWECGFMVVWFMFQFVLKKRFHFPNNIWTQITSVTQEEIDMLVENIMTRFFKMVIHQPKVP